MIENSSLIDEPVSQLGGNNGDLQLLVPADDVSNPELTILIPSKNEELTIGTFIDWCQEGLRRGNIRGEILMIDSSTDATAEIALSKGARVLKVPRREWPGSIDSIPFVRVNMS